MGKPVLTTTTLTRGGFEEIGCWSLNEMGKLYLSIEIPRRPGVYAFAIHEVVQYVGLASVSVNQRLGFYRRPGPTQRTNIRLNGIITDEIKKGAAVQIFLAFPPDFEWHGFRVSGAEGLEAGLIAAFDLPWNMSGARLSGTAGVDKSPQLPSTKGDTAGGRVLELVKRRPGMTELELAKSLYGPSAVQQRVNQECRKLLNGGLITRRGRGGSADPFTYYPKR